MSLLLDALKRAEQEKLAKQGERPANEAQAAPRRDAPAAAASAPAPSLELQPLGSAAKGAAAAAQAKSAATAQAVFQAKAAPAKEEGARKTTVLWIAGALIVLAMIGIGGYVWYQMSSLQPRDFRTVRPRSAPTPPPASADALPTRQDTLVPGAIAPAPRGETQSMAATSMASISPPPATPAAAAAPSSPGAPKPAPATNASANAPARSASAAPTPESAAQLVKDAPASTPTMRLTPTEKPRVPVEVAAGYEALRSGDLASARRSYSAALASGGANLDAHLGLATVEARLGNAAAAASHYRRALDLDPRNATALAGLASLADSAPPEMVESQLRADLARYPQSASLHFALGNLYALRARWEDAQAEFFEAHRLEPASADVLFNLAVSMDHMGQSRLAAEYYRRALDAARGQAAQFDPDSVARRLAELRP